MLKGRGGTPLRVDFIHYSTHKKRKTRMGGTWVRKPNETWPKKCKFKLSKKHCTKNDVSQPCDETLPKSSEWQDKISHFCTFPQFPFLNTKFYHHLASNLPFTIALYKMLSDLSVAYKTLPTEQIWMKTFVIHTEANTSCISTNFPDV